jgi:hypothetical protein
MARSFAHIAGCHPGLADTPTSSELRLKPLVRDRGQRGHHQDNTVNSPTLMGHPRCRFRITAVWMAVCLWSGVFRLGFVADSGSAVTEPPALSVAALVWLQTVAFT